MSSIQPDALTGAGHVAQQAAFARIELRAIRRIGGDADRHGQVVDDRLEVFLAPRRVATVPATPIAPEPDGGRVGVQTPGCIGKKGAPYAAFFRGVTNVWGVSRSWIVADC